MRLLEQLDGVGSCIVAAVLVLSTACGPGTPARDAGMEAGQEMGVLSRCEPLVPQVECASDSECAVGACVGLAFGELIDQEPARLGCGDPVGPGESGAFCSLGRECASALCAVSGGCVYPCGADEDCVEGDWCRSLWVHGEDEATHRVSACVPMLQLADDVDGARSLTSLVMVGEVDTLDVMGASAPSMYLLDGLCDVWPELLGMETASAGMPYYESTTWGSAVQANPIAADYIPLSFLVPSGDGASPVPGGYQLSFEASDTTALGVTRVTGSPAGRRLDLDIYYVSLPTLAPEGSRGPPRVAEALDEVESIFMPAGISIGEVRQHVIGGELGARFTIVDFEEPGVSDELPALFRLSAGAAGPSIALFLVRSVDFAIARSGGVPGPLGRSGTAGSGIAFSSGVLDTGRELGHAIAHELGHYLGLFHPTESRGTVYEGLEDTPVCTEAHDTDGDGFLSAEECAGAGADNLMFWSQGGTELSASQIEILTRAPILR